MRACIPIDLPESQLPDNAILYPGGKALTVNIHGSYRLLSQAYALIGEFMTAHGYISAGYPQEIYVEFNTLQSPDVDDPGNITQVMVPVQKLP